MNEFEVISGGRELIDLVQPLWEKLNYYHEMKSNYFSHKFKSQEFHNRKNKFVNEKEIQVYIELIKDNNVFIGYCISTINKDLIGEIDSLFVEKEYRNYGLGDKMINNALEWLNANQSKTIIIAVSEGNEEVIEFYKRYGFYKRRIILEKISE